MSRHLLVLIAVLALAGAALWFTTASRTTRGARPVESEAPAAEVEREAAPLAPAPANAPKAEDEDEDEDAEPAAVPAATPAHRESAAANESELARAQWIDGRVLFPPGTPDDERVFVTASGKKFE